MFLKEQHLQSLMTNLQLFLSILFIASVPVTLIIIQITILVKKDKEYKSGAYYQVTKLPYKAVKHDKGRFGEFLIYKNLKELETVGAKFLFNLYIPKGDGKTSEIDVLMVCTKGIFVFESKNFSGWIFGNEFRKNWYQTLPNGKGGSHKEIFYNPVMQNRSHIKYLRSLIEDRIPIWSVIVFSDRCTLKDIQVTGNDVIVIKRSDVFAAVSSICGQISNDPLSEDDVIAIYNRLYSYTQVDDAVKTQHIDDIHNILNPELIQNTEISADVEPEPIPVEDTPNNEVETADTKSPSTVTEAQTTDCNKKKGTEDEIANEEQPRKCPRCGGDLVIRTAKRGANAGNQFYGCSNYPKCRFTQNISNTQK